MNQRNFRSPGVITRKLLLDLVVEQGPVGDAARLFLEDGVRLDDVIDIRIEFRNILNVHLLWTMRNLVKLSLSNNIIERIENLDTLTCLKELDLSFNRIRVIENLSRLRKLEILLLSNNRITVIGGMDGLLELEIFSVAFNQISDWEHVIYLRKFQNLRSFSINGNPCVRTKGYYDYLFGFLPRLIYSEWKAVSSWERREALDRHYRSLSNLEECESKRNDEFQSQREREEKFSLLSLCFVEHLDQDSFFQEMFLRDKDGQQFARINEDTENAFEEYKKTISRISCDLCRLGLRECERRTNEIKLFANAIRRGKDAVYSQSREIVDAMLGKKEQYFNATNELTKSIMDETEIEVIEERLRKLRALSEEFNGHLSNMWNVLMSKETVLHDRTERVNEIFKINMMQMVESFLELAREHFSRMRSAEAEYNDIVGGLVSFYVAGFGDEERIPKNLLVLCRNEDTLSNSLAGSHDLRLQTIDDRETRMTNQLGHWFEEMIERVAKEEFDRNRDQILEISHFLECQRKEFFSLLPLQGLRMVGVDGNVLEPLQT